MESAGTSAARWQGVDIIGDIHGCSQTLEKLLLKMDYRRDGTVYYHPNRQAVFLGDIVDRGPHIREALQIIKPMVDAGNALCILGNHEYNAICYTKVVGDKEGEPVYLRPHNKRNNRLISETLIQFASFPEEWRAYLEWFKTLPLYYDFDAFRVVHACWDPEAVSILNALDRAKAVVNDEFLNQHLLQNPSIENAVDRLIHGTSIKLPENRKIAGRDGYIRNYFRTKFWASSPKLYQDVVFQPDPLPEDLVKRPLAGHELQHVLDYPASDKPVFFGHYWLHGQPRLQRPNVACLDYSAVKYGRLVAYRFDGESQLHNSKFEWVYVDPAVDSKRPG